MGSKVNWEYGGAYKNVCMDGAINLPNGSKVMVCDLRNQMPEFMKEADTLFIDPPCNQGNLQSFHTKSENELLYSFNEFESALFNRIVEISPKHLFIEVFKSNRGIFLERCKKLFSMVFVHESMYYGRTQNKCWIVHCTNDVTQRRYSEIDGIDEAKAIKWICENHIYECIGDLCMGKGLVGRYAFNVGKKFVGTELNKKRLAVLVDHIKNGTKWSIK